MLTLIVISSLLISSTVTLYSGDSCKLAESDVSGTCISISVCDYAKELLNSQKLPQTCGFNVREPLVCCPLSDKSNPSPPSRSADKCNLYYDAESPVPNVHGGAPALPKEFPHMAAVGFGDSSEILWLCGGSLISEKFVLTAAHCTKSREFGIVKWVRLGDLDLTNTTEDANPLDLSIERFFVHPGYKYPSHYNDIALLQLKNIVFQPYYKPACLNTNKELSFNNLQATGWGKTDIFGETSSHLMKVNLNLIEYDKCSRAFTGVSSRKLARGIVNEIQICAGDSAGTGKDTCPGDSGGPLHVRIEGNKKLSTHFLIIGITSFGKVCGIESTVGVYTRVSTYIEWIENIVWPTKS